MNFLINLCENSDFLTIILVISRIIKLFCFVAPIILIVMISIDFSKNVIANSEDDMRKTVNTALKRIIYCVAVFLAPTIVTFVINLIPEIPILPNVTASNIKKCITNANAEKIDTIKEQEDAYRVQQHATEKNKEKIINEIESDIKEVEKLLKGKNIYLGEQGDAYYQAKKKFETIKQKNASEITVEELNKISTPIKNLKNALQGSSNQNGDDLVNMEPNKTLTEELKNQTMSQGSLITIAGHTYKITKITTSQNNETFYTIRESDSNGNLKESARPRTIRKKVNDNGTIEFNETYG